MASDPPTTDASAIVFELLPPPPCVRTFSTSLPPDFISLTAIAVLLNPSAPSPQSTEPTCVVDCCPLDSCPFFHCPSNHFFQKNLAAVVLILCTPAIAKICCNDRLAACISQLASLSPWCPSPCLLLPLATAPDSFLLCPCPHPWCPAFPQGPPPLFPASSQLQLMIASCHGLPLASPSPSLSSGTLYTPSYPWPFPLPTIP